MTTGIKTLYLIDGTSHAYRAFYAIKGLSTSFGQPTNAVFGLTRMLHKFLEKKSPEYVAVAFDKKGPTFRHLEYEGYKAQRKPTPQELLSQLPFIKEIISGYGITVIEQDGYEADDIIATLATHARKQGFEVLILTEDKDMLQLVDEKVTVMGTQRGEIMYDAAKVIEKFGVPPDHIADLLALMGDSVDNIPGVPGIGNKTALELLKNYETLDGIMANIEHISAARVKRNLGEYREQAFLSKRLATVCRDVSLGIELENLLRSTPDLDKLAHVFKELEFMEFLKEVLKTHASGREAGEPVHAMVTHPAEAGIVLEDAQQSSAAGISVCDAGVGIYFDKGTAYYIAVNGKDDPVLAEVKALFCTPSLEKICHDMKAGITLLRAWNIHLAPPCFDTMLAAHLLNPSRNAGEFVPLAFEYLDADTVSPDAMADPQQHPEAYQCAVAQTLLSLKEKLEPLLRDANLYQLFEEVEIPLVTVLVEMEEAGITVDPAILKRLSRELGEMLTGLTNTIYKLAGMEFNINSPKQLAAVLFEKLKLPPSKKTKTGYSTDTSALLTLSKFHELPKQVLEYRQLLKLKTTYTDVLPTLVNPATGRIHTSYNQASTETGRLSSRNPNLQNIPIRSELGRKIREAFIPSSSENLLLSVDYSQIELRILAHLSGDELLLKAFSSGDDVHRITASEIFSIPVDEVTEEMRDKAKTVNFGVIYGMSAYGLSNTLGIPREEAQSFIDLYFSRYQGVKQYTQTIIEQARKQGYVTTLLKRRRYIRDLLSENTSTRQFAERMAINTPIQGSAADIIKLAMIRISRLLKGAYPSVSLLLQVHDELIFEVPADTWEALADAVKRTMEEIIELKVALMVDIKVGHTWRDL